MLGDSTEKKESTHRAQAVWNTLGVVGNLVGNYIILIFLIRIGNLADAGIFSLCLAVVGIFQEISIYNIRIFQISDSYTKFTETSYIFTRFFSILISSICYCLFLLYMRYEKIVVLSISLYFLSRNIIIFFDVFTIKVQIKKRLDILGKGSFFSGICNAMVFIMSYVLYQNIILAFFCMTFFSSVFCILFTFYAYNKVVGIYPFAVIQYKRRYIYDAYRLLKLGFPLCISVLLSSFIFAIPKILLERYSNNETVGIFSALTTPAVLIPTIASSLFAPYIVYFTDLLRNAKYKTIIKKTLLLGLFVCIGCLLSLLLNSLVGLKVFQFIYGNKIAEFHSFFMLILIAYFMVTFSTILTTILIIVDERRFILFSSIIISAVCCILLPYLIKYYKLFGVSVGIIIIYLLQMLLLLFGLLSACKKLIQLYVNTGLSHHE